MRGADMTTFDQIEPIVLDLLETKREWLKTIPWLLVNRDLNGKVRLIAPEEISDDPVGRQELEAMAVTLAERLGPHSYPADKALLFEPDRSVVCQGAPHFRIEDHENVWVVDRLATEGDWACITPVSSGAPRIAFYSIKGGVGRSTALAVTAWWLAQAGKRVLVLDLDLESPGLSSSLLPPDRQPAYGIADWLVEDLVDNANDLLLDMVATSGLSHDGEIFVVPAHGVEPGDYVAKLGRVWMPKVSFGGISENWSKRLRRLIDNLETRLAPDVILIDSRAGIDEVASSCVTDLGAGLVLLFSLEGAQTWTGYRILFQHWLKRGVAEEIRERLQIVGSMLPETDQIEYLEGLRDHAYDLFANALYDSVPAGETFGERWHFEPTDDSAPHYPWGVKWQRGLAGLRSLHGRLAVLEVPEVRSIFGPLLDGITCAVGMEDRNA